MAEAIESYGILVNEVTQIKVTDSEGKTMHPGDTIIIRIDTQDIICDFVGIEGGYFITKTHGDGIRNRYRVKSIKKSKVIKTASNDAENKEE